MALWNNVLSGFDREDETINFGARAVAENNETIYETFTVATIQSDGEVINDPSVLASIQYSKLCVAIDKSITIFNDDTCQEVNLSIGFESLITCYCISKDESFLFVALANGILYCLHLPTGGKVVFCKDIPIDMDSCDTVIKLFLQDCGNESVDIILVSAKGSVYKISSFSIELVHTALVEENEARIDDTMKDIRCIELFEESKNKQISSVEVGTLCGEMFVAMIGTDICMWPSKRSCCLNALPYTYIKARFLKKYNAILCLRADRTLNIVCPWTLLGRNVWDGPISDFIVVQDNPNDLPYILVLMASENGSTATLQFVSFPDFDTKFKIEVSSTTYLVELIDSSVDNIIFLEGVNSTKKMIETIRVKAVMENKPEDRLERLLRREKYEEAEIFARKFCLSMEAIYCSKAASLMSQLHPWTKDTDDDINKLNTFINTLDKIKNVKYVFECCTNALTFNHKHIRTLLLYARERLVHHVEGLSREELSDFLSILNSTLLRLETFEIIQNTELNVERHDGDDIKEWIKFSKADLIDECSKYLMLGELEIAALIWARHLPDMMSKIRVETVQNILKVIPKEVPISRLWSWLHQFVPSLLFVLPNAFLEIVLWGYEKTKSLEKFHHNAWPQIGLDFANDLMKLLNSEESHLNFHSQLRYGIKNAQLQRLSTLIQALSDLKQLKVNHRIVVPLDIYMGKPIDVVHVLLSKVHTEGISLLVDKFLRQYMFNHFLKNDDVLTSYIQSILSNSRGWWFWEEAPWEKRIAIIIGFIHNVQTRLQQIIEVLKKAPVPWSPTMLTLAEAGYTTDHFLASEIRIERNSVPIKLILKKYGYQHIGLNRTLIAYIVKENRKEMMDDIYELTRTNHSLRMIAFSLCTNFYLNKGDIVKAMNVINNLEDDVALYCCKQIVNYISTSLQFKEMDKSLSHYVEALDLVQVKLCNISSKLETQSLNWDDTILTASTVRSLYHLRKEFSINITLTKYHIKKQKVLQNYIKHLNVAIESGNLPMSRGYKQVERIADLLGISRLLAVCLLFKETKNVDVFRQCIERVKGNGSISIEESYYINKLCSMAVFTVQKDQNFELNVMTDLSTFALSKCCNEQLCDVLSSMIWINLYASVMGCENPHESILKRDTVSKTTWKLYATYTDAAVCAQQMLLPLLRDSLKLYSFYAGAGKTIDESVLFTREEINELLKGMLIRVKKIQIEHCDYSLLQAVKILHFSCCSIVSVNENILVETCTLLRHCLYTLLQKVIGARSFDLQLGLSCLFMLAERDALKWLSTVYKSLLTDYARHRAVSELGYEYCRLIGNEKQMWYFDYHRMQHYWAQRLTDYGISYKEILNSNSVLKQEILERVMDSHKSGTTQLLEEFCIDFEFDLNDCFMLYLQILLKKWKPTLNFINTSTGKKELEINENEVQELCKKCKDIVARIEDKAAVKNHIATFWSTINFYHYEVYLIMMELVEDKDEEKINHLCFLQNYTRIGSPTQVELDEWAHLSLENGSLPSISEWRLPFLPEIDQWKLIIPELNLKTYEQWIEVAPVLGLQVHIICTLAVKGALAQARGNVDTIHNTNEWSLCLRDSTLLKDIKKCILRITGQNASNYGTAALYYVVNHTQQGADQVAAARECYAYAQQWIHEENGLDKGMIQKIKYKYLDLSSKHNLYVHGLGEDRYLRLALYPEKLIRNLYADESIPLRYRGITWCKPDINSAVNGVGKIFSFNVMKVRLELLQEWLQPETKEIKLNDTINDTISIAPTNLDNGIADDNLLRACYVLEYKDTGISVNYLINIGFSERAEDNVGPRVRYRALWVLQSITDPVTLQNLTKRDLCDIRQYVKLLQYLSELETLGLVHSIDGFRNCSKCELVQALWKTHSYSPQALTLILQICIDYKLQDYSIWDKTLNRMTKLLMINELRKTLPIVGTVNMFVVNCDGYISGWQLILSEPFRKADVPPSPEQIEECIKSLCLLHACPVASKLHFEEIIKYCFRCRQAHFAAVLLPFLENDEDKENVLQMIQQTSDVSKVMEDLKSLASKGILTISYSLRLLQGILLPNVKSDRFAVGRNEK